MPDRFLGQWPDKHTFYAERGGWRSLEIDYGSHNWLHGSDPHQKWLVALVVDAGDVYAHCLGSHPSLQGVLLVGTVEVPLDYEPFGLSARRRGEPPVIAVCDALLKGWETGGLGKPVQWFLGRLQPAAKGGRQP